MSLWGKTAAGTQAQKPKWLSTDEDSEFKKQNVFAQTAGWAQSAGTKASGNDNTGAQEEILACVGGLSTTLAGASVTSVRWTTTATAAATRTVTAQVTFDEQVTVTAPNASNEPRIVCAVASSFPATTLSYASGTGTNRLTFSKASVAVNNGGTCSIGGGSGAAITYAGTGAIADGDGTAATVATTGTAIATYTGTA
tara:strand:- start:104 stop:694 length:591 start_codon:yes stop_codon:yes gene_type:complete